MHTQLFRNHTAPAMSAIERLAMIQSQMDLDQRRYVPSFPYMSPEERARYDPEQFYKTTYNKRPPSPVVVHTLSPQHQQQIRLQRTSAGKSSSSPPTPSPPALSSPRACSPTLGIAGRESTPRKKTNLDLDGLVKGLNKEKVLCINKNQDKIEIKDTVVLQESIHDLSDEKFADDYDVVILNELGQKANYEMSLYLKSIHEDVILVIRDELKPNTEDGAACQYDYYVDLSNIVSEASGGHKVDG
ncbi:hypothetical protein Cantr_08021 [Candida viswanathii]|uniref:Uncharacterized protein n=1 Tax=Candida viswanathii TaxID=5486 RepID=A0A367Y5Z7_9ASCO|nr:hypothetical protein Cantr_08021 [Candida viswanathii]